MNLVEFWKTFGSTLLSILASLIVIILYFVKKRPTANLLDREIIDLLYIIPDFIKDAETKYQRGEDKKAFVLKEIESYLSCIVFDKCSVDYKSLLSFMDSFVESVLDTPRKKKGE